MTESENVVRQRESEKDVMNKKSRRGYKQGNEREKREREKRERREREKRE